MGACPLTIAEAVVPLGGEVGPDGDGVAGEKLECQAHGGALGSPASLGTGHRMTVQSTKNHWSNSLRRCQQTRAKCDSWIAPRAAGASRPATASTLPAPDCSEKEK